MKIFLSGTGIVTSVPSDAPDDYAALRDVKNKGVSGLLLNVHTCQKTLRTKTLVLDAKKLLHQRMCFQRPVSYK